MSEVDSSMWLGGGTANIPLKKRIPDDENERAVLENKSQMIFGLNADACETLGRSLCRSSAADGSWSPLDGEDAVMPDGKLGWYINLQVRAGWESESVSAKPVAVGRTLFVPTFTYRNIALGDNDALCTQSKSSIEGYSRLYALDISNGSANMWSGSGKKVKYLTMQGVKITGLTISRRPGGKVLFINTSKLDSWTEPVIDYSGNLQKVEGGGSNPKYMRKLPSQPRGVQLKSGETVLAYWLEK
jgi:hypothetical protein